MPQERTTVSSSNSDKDRKVHEMNLFLQTLQRKAEMKRLQERGKSQASLTAEFFEGLKIVQ